MPGRKTDVRDCEWLAELLRHGLLTGSFVPDRPQRELRELTRYRTSLVRERTAAANRLQKTLEGANIKLASVATDILGKSGREILAALVAGETDGAELAQLAQGRLREKIPQLERALVGRVGPHQRFLVAEQLAHIDFLDEAIARVSAEIAERVRPDEDAIARLDTIPGVGRSVAEALVAEIGADLSALPECQAPGLLGRAVPGQPRERRQAPRAAATRKGSPWLRACLVQAAHAAARTKGTYLAAQYRRLAARRGRAKAAVAVAHSILIIAYHLLTEGTVYRDLGGNYFDERDRQAVERRLVHRLEGLGYTVSLDTGRLDSSGRTLFSDQAGALWEPRRTVSARASVRCRRTPTTMPPQSSPASRAGRCSDCGGRHCRGRTWLSRPPAGRRRRLRTPRGPGQAPRRRRGS